MTTEINLDISEKDIYNSIRDFKFNLINNSENMSLKKYSINFQPKHFLFQNNLFYVIFSSYSPVNLAFKLNNNREKGRKFYLIGFISKFQNENGDLKFFKKFENLDEFNFKYYYEYLLNLYEKRREEFKLNRNLDFMELINLSQNYIEENG